MILNYGPDVCVPHPPHFLKNLAKLEEYFGDLGREQNLRELIRASLSYLSFHPYQWNLVTSVSEVFSCLVSAGYPRSLLGVQCALYDLFTIREGKNRWGCKSTFSVRHIHEIKRELPNALFIHLVRDPRDVCVSAKKSQFNHFHPLFTARLWAQEQLMAQTASSDYPESTIVIRYEDLIERPREVVAGLCQFLDISFCDSMLEYYRGSEAQRSSSLSQSWKNTGREILSSNKGSFVHELPLSEVLLVEAECYPLMERYQYPLTQSKVQLERVRVRCQGRAPLGFLMSEKLQMLRMQLSLFKSDKNNGLRIAKFWFVKWLNFRLRFLSRGGVR